MVILPSSSSLMIIYFSAMCFTREAYVQLPATCNVEVFSRYNDTLLNHFLKPSFTIMLKQNTALFMVSAAVTSFASIVYCAVRLWGPTLKLIGSMASITIYKDVDLPLSGLLPQFASG